jgi:ABC-type multidrug transport system fused ATPase/permease subunit
LYAFLGSLLVTLFAALALTALFTIVRFFASSGNDIKEIQRNTERLAGNLDEKLAQLITESRTRRESALASASPDMRYLFSQMEKERDDLRKEIEKVREATTPHPVRQWFGNFFWNFGFLIAGIIIGHFIH